MRGAKVVSWMLTGFTVCLTLASARCGEWDDYLNSPYHDFRWDWLVRDGHLAYQQSGYSEALKIYAQAMEKGCKDPLVLFRMGYCYRTLRKNKEAAEYFAASMEKLPEAYPKHRYNWFGPYYLAELSFEAAMLQPQKKEERESLIARAKQQLQEAVKRNPKFFQAYLLLGNIHYQEGQYDLSAEKYLRAHEINPKSVEALANLGASYDAAGKSEEALSAYLKAKALSPEDAKTCLALAGMYSKMKELQKAIEQYEYVLKLHPDSEAALIGAGLAAWENGDNEKAVEYYQRALGVNLGSYDALLGLGLAMLKKEQWDDAEKYFLRSLEVKPQSREAHYNLGVLYDAKGDFDRAIKEFTRAIEIDPNDESCWYNVGLAFIKAGNYEQAKEWLNKAIQTFGKESKWGKADLKLLELIDKIEKTKEAEVEKELKKALESEKPNPPE